MSKTKITIDPEALNAFKLTLPEDIREEHFRWLITDYSVVRALFLIKEQNLELGNINVEAWCKALGMAGEKDMGKFAMNIINGVTDEDALKENINPDIPIIIVEHEFGRGRKKETSTLVIDGNKRLRKAFLEKREKIKGYFLKRDLAKLCIV